MSGIVDGSFITISSIMPNDCVTLDSCYIHLQLLLIFMAEAQYAHTVADAASKV